MQTFSTFKALVVAALVAAVSGQSLKVNNKCSEDVLLFTQNSFGTIKNNVVVKAGQSGVDLGISKDWDGAVNVGTGCKSDGSSCTTGGPTWNGVTPFSRAEFNFHAIPGKVTYDISMIYGFNVGMEITSGDKSCDQFSCDLKSVIGSCPAPGPSGSCFSPCCNDKNSCSGGALPASGGGCKNNALAGPHSPFYDQHCPNAYAFPDNDGANGATPKNNVDFTCGNTDITLTLCSGTSSNIKRRSYPIDARYAAWV